MSISAYVGAKAPDNTVWVTVDGGRYTVEPPFYQWDRDQTLQIFGLSLSETPEIHFTNTDMERAIVRQATTDAAGVITVKVPNSLLQKPYKISVYVCTYEGGEFKALYKMVCPVTARTKPSDYVIEDTDGEIYSFNALENKIDNALALSLERYGEINRKYGEAYEIIEGVIDKATVAKNAAQAAQGAAETARDETVAAKKGIAEDVTKAEEARSAIENMTVTVKELDLDEGATVEKTIEGDAIKLEFGIPVLRPASGLTQSAHDLLVTILKNAVFVTDQAENIAAFAEMREPEDTGGSEGGSEGGSGGEETKPNVISLTVVWGAATRSDGVKLTYDCTAESSIIRGATNPLAFYVEEGKTYTISLASYDNYGFYPQGLSYSTSGTDFTVVEGTTKVFNGDFTRTLAPGWQYADYIFTPDGTYQVIALQFRNKANTELTADDIAALNELLTVTVTGGQTNTPDTPDNPDGETLPLTVALGATTRSDGIKLTYDTTSAGANIRASINPLAVYVESGKTYKIALSDYSTYGLNLQLMTYSTKDTDFTIVEGTQRIINGDFTRTYTSGWKHEDIIYTADGAADIFVVMMAKGSAHNEELTTDDIAALNSMLTVTVE